ncbi:MAG: MmgE/PrpD family protein [Burkholderiales bacterium]
MTRLYRSASQPFGPLPEAVVRKAKLMLLDTVACMLTARSAPEVRAFERSLSAMDAGSFRFPGGEPLSLLGAAAVGAMSATWDEACEGLAMAHGRPGVPVIAALLPFAITRALSLDALLRSLVVGYEVGARAGAWLRIRPGMHVDGNWPALGVAAGMADAMHLSPAACDAALDITACQLPASLYLPVARGANARNTYLSHSAWLGILAANAAAAGISAPTDALSHYAQHFAEKGDVPQFPVDQYLILDAYFKPHAAVRHVHYGAEAARLLRDHLRGQTGSITAIRLKIYQEAITYCGNRAPRQPIQAQFSLSFGVAAALIHGGIEASVYRDENFNHPELRRLEALVQIEQDTSLTAANQRGATLSIDAGGQRYSEDVAAIKGDPDLPMSEGEVRDKFLRYVAARISATSADKFVQALIRGDSATGMDQIWKLLF